jgi:hypothetical protein
MPRQKPGEAVMNMVVVRIKRRFLCEQTPENTQTGIQDGKTE